MMRKKGRVFVQQGGGEQDVTAHVLLATGDLSAVMNADVVMVQSVTQKQVNTGDKGDKTSIDLELLICLVRKSHRYKMY